MSRIEQRHASFCDDDSVMRRIEELARTREIADAAIGTGLVGMRMPQARPETGPRAEPLSGRCIDRLEEHPLHLRKLRSNRRLACGYRLDEVAADQCRIHSRLYGNEEVVAVLHRHELPKFDDPGLRLEELADAAT